MIDVDTMGMFIASSFLWFIIIPAIFIILPIVLIVALSKKRRKNKNQTLENPIDSSIHQTQQSQLKQEKFPYILTNTVFSPKETKFYEDLKIITDELNLTIFTKMRIADLVYVPKNHPQYMKWFNYVKAKHVDFVICNNTHKPLLIVECDDKTHYRQSRMKRDEFVDEIFQQVGLKVVHVFTWNDERLKQTILYALGLYNLTNNPTPQGTHQS